MARAERKIAIKRKSEYGHTVSKIDFGIEPSGYRGLLGSHLVPDANLLGLFPFCRNVAAFRAIDLLPGSAELTVGEGEIHTIEIFPQLDFKVELAAVECAF